MRLYQVHVCNKYHQYTPVKNQSYDQFMKAMKRQDASKCSSFIQGRIDKFIFPTTIKKHIKGTNDILKK